MPKENQSVLYLPQQFVARVVQEDGNVRIHGVASKERFWTHYSTLLDVEKMVAAEAALRDVKSLAAENALLREQLAALDPAVKALKLYQEQLAAREEEVRLFKQGEQARQRDLKDAQESIAQTRAANANLSGNLSETRRQLHHVREAKVAAQQQLADTNKQLQAEQSRRINAETRLGCVSRRKDELKRQRGKWRNVARQLKLVDDDVYLRLCCAQDASLEDLTARFRKLSILAHPDKGGSSTSFQRISEAYSVLRNPDSRAAIDAGKGLDVARDILAGTLPPGSSVFNIDSDEDSDDE